jgi:hypothetical protein
MARSPDELDELLTWAYKGEVFGESLFRSLEPRFPAHAGELSALADLEQCMAAVLAAVLDANAMDLGACDGSRDAGRKAAEALGSSDWNDFVDHFDAATNAALEKYRRMREIVSAAHRHEMDLLIAHEEALQSFAAVYKGESDDDSLAEVHRVTAELAAIARR